MHSYHTILYSLGSGIIGAVIGSYSGAWLANRYQHKQWVLENKKTEFQELLKSFVEYRAMIVKVLLDRKAILFTESELQKIALAYDFLFSEIYTKFFIQNVIEKNNIQNDLRNLHSELIRQATPLDEWDGKYATSINKIRNIAFDFMKTNSSFSLFFRTKENINDKTQNISK